LDKLLSADDGNETVQAYYKAKHADIMFTQNELSEQAAYLLGAVAEKAGHLNKPRSGVIQLKPNNNSQGLADLGVNTDGAALAERVESGQIRGLFVFGEDIPHINLEKLNFLAVQDIFMTETAEKSDAVFPCAAFSESKGTFTNTVGQISAVRPALPGVLPMRNWEMIQALANVGGDKLRYRNEDEIFDRIKEAAPSYRLGYIKPESAGRANIAAPADKPYHLYADRANTHTLHRMFAAYLDRNGLLKK